MLEGDQAKKAHQGRYYIATIVTPIVAFTLLLGAISAQLLQYSYAGAVNAQHLTQFHGTLSPLLASSNLLGHADSQQRIALSLGLRPRNENTLDNYVQQIMQPDSAVYHQFLTPARYATLYSPQDDTYTRLRNYLSAAGFTITHTYNHHLLISFNGTVEQVERAFHVTINSYAAADGHHYYANATEPQLPASIANLIISVNGLNNAAAWHRATLYHPLTGQAPHTSTIAACPGPGQGYLTPDQVATAYHLKELYNEHLQGERQTIALFELNTFDMNDLNAYMACFGHAHTKIETIPTGSSPVASDSGAIEVEMDAELILSAAPELGTLKIYQAGNSQASYLEEWAQIVQDGIPIISTSWGACEASLDPATLQQEHVLLQTAVAQGQSIFAAAGDTGSNSCLYQPNNTILPRLNASDPAAQPFVTGVGGTSLTLTNTSTYTSETVWNSLTVPAARLSGGASGGGISQYWPMPSWQNAPGVHNSFTASEPCQSAAGNPCREIPDVAFSADPHNGYIIYCTVAYAGCDSAHPWIIIGGTSTATPLWAAMIALTDQLALRQNGSSPGFITPLLYQIARNPQQYRLCFHDIRIGNNDYLQTNNGRYPATANYDLTSGLGSYQAYNLARTLVRISQRPSMQP